MRETEVKVALPDGPQEILERLRDAGARRIEEPTLEDDRLFDTASGELRRGDRVLRLRRRGDRALLTLKGPAEDDPAFKVRREWETEVDDPGATTGMLEELGFTPAVRYQKVRSRYDLDGVRVCVDEIPVGHFLELEGRRRDIERVAARLKIDPERFDRRDYLQIWRHRGGHGDMTFGREP